MIVVLKRGAEQDKREQLINWLKNQGLGVHISEGEYQTVLGLIGDTARVDMDLIESLSIVDSVKRVTEPFKCCNRKFHPDDMIVQVGDVKVGGGNFCMIAGPCSVESEEQIVAVAKEANPGKSSKDYTPADWAKVHNIITGAIEPEAPAAQPEPEPDEFTDDLPF